MSLLLLAVPLQRVYTLFVDVKRSTQFLMEYQSEFMFNEAPEREEGEDEEEEEGIEDNAD